MCMSPFYPGKTLCDRFTQFDYKSYCKYEVLENKRIKKMFIGTVLIAF